MASASNIARFTSGYLIYSEYSRLLTNTGASMKTILLMPILIMFFIIALCSAAGAWEIEYVGVTGAVQDMKRMQWVKEHTHERPPQYLDPIGAMIEEKIDKSGEKYSFQMAVNKINQGRPNE